MPWCTNCRWISSCWRRTARIWRPTPTGAGRNEPALLPLVCDRIAELCGRTATEIANTTTANAMRCFGLPGPVPTT